MSDEYTLGQRVRFTWTITRMSAEHQDEFNRRQVWRSWRATESVEPPAREGIVTGVRWLHNGWLDHTPEFDGLGYSSTVMVPNYVQKETFKAYIIAFHLRCKPVMVLPADCEGVSDVGSDEE